MPKFRDIHSRFLGGFDSPEGSSGGDPTVDGTTGSLYLVPSGQGNGVNKFETLDEVATAASALRALGAVWVIVYVSGRAETYSTTSTLDFGGFTAFVGDPAYPESVRPRLQTSGAEGQLQCSDGESVVVRVSNLRLETDTDSALPFFGNGDVRNFGFFRHVTLSVEAASIFHLEDAPGEHEMVFFGNCDLVPELSSSDPDDDVFVIDLTNDGFGSPSLDLSIGAGALVRDKAIGYHGVNEAGFSITHHDAASYIGRCFANSDGDNKVIQAGGNRPRLWAWHVNQIDAAGNPDTLRQGALIRFDDAGTAAAIAVGSTFTIRDDTLNLEETWTAVSGAPGAFEWQVGTGAQADLAALMTAIITDSVQFEGASGGQVQGDPNGWYAVIYLENQVRQYHPTMLYGSITWDAGSGQSVEFWRSTSGEQEFWGIQNGAFTALPTSPRPDFAFFSTGIEDGLYPGTKVDVLFGEKLSQGPTTFVRDFLGSWRDLYSTASYSAADAADWNNDAPDTIKAALDRIAAALGPIA